MTDSLQQQLQTSLGTAYTIKRELGGGGMSRVFVAEETAFGEQAAVADDVEVGDAEGVAALTGARIREGAIGNELRVPIAEPGDRWSTHPPPRLVAT